MSLLGALNTARSGLAAQQAAIQVTGNNIANAGNADYTRQTAALTPSPDQQIRPGMFVGTGVDLGAIQRQVDDALEGRLRASVSDNTAAESTQQWLSRVEATFNELGDNDLSTQLSTFFNSWSSLANKPQDMGLRQVVLQNGDALAKQFQGLRKQLTDLQGDVDSRLASQVKAADGLAQQIASLNGQIVTSEAGSGGSANNLRDQRDAALKQLSQVINIKTVPQDNGVVNVYVGSEPLVFNGDSRGVDLKQQSVGGVVAPVVVFKTTGGPLQLAGSGELGSLTDVRARIGGVVDQTDTLAHNLIFELNELHASGQGLQGFSSATATNAVADPTVPLNDSRAGLPFTPVNGSFVVHVRQKSTGIETTTLVQVDLDGLNNNDTTLNSLQASLSGIAGVNAAVSGGRLQVAASSDAVDVSFSQDSSGVLAGLGLNTFYSGKDAKDIAVNGALMAQPALLAAAKNGDQADNQTARAIAALESQPVGALNGTSLKDTYQNMVNGVSSQASAAKTNADATKAVQDTLESQREALSGVSLDEEALNLMRQQRAYQAAARLISTVDDLTRTLLSIT